MSPDTVSPLYPDRPIRPLPKRRLRERLSPDVAESIKFPPAPKTTTPLFYYPYTAADDGKIPRTVESQLPSEQERVEETDSRNYISRRNPEDADSDEDELAYRSRIYPRHTPDTPGRAYRFVEKPDATRKSPQPPGSTTSSADGYDSFENTNNKKKRKIPTPGDSGMNGSHLSSDLATMGISSNSDDLRVEAGPYYNSSPSSSGLSGPGRGRYGRVRNGRSPLRNLSDASSNWSNGRSSKQRQPQWSSPGEGTGIISNAIANAEKLPVTPSRGQENVSLLQQQASKKSSPASAQFTFTCDSQVPGTVTWPKLETPVQSTMNQSPAATANEAKYKVSSHATQTSPSSTRDRQHIPPPPPAPKANGAAAAPNGHPKKTRRRASKEYKLAMYERRQQQQYQNRRHPPAPEDIWICEFCEYESIFGEQPLALMRQYEIKDRKEKRKAEEKRRLLEKAKMKGRKGKKANKNMAKDANHAKQTQQPAAQQAPAQSRSQSQGTQSEEYYEDDDDYAAAEGPPTPAPAPYNMAKTRDTTAVPPKIPETHGDPGPPVVCH